MSRGRNGPIRRQQCDVTRSIFRYDVMTSSGGGGGRACAGGGVKGQSRDDRPSPFNIFNGKKDEYIHEKMFTVRLFKHHNLHC